MPRRIPRIASAVILGIVFMACVVGSIMTLILSPHPGTGRISGVILDLPNGYVVVTHHNLDCDRQAPESLSETCRFMLGGDELTVNVTHGAMDQFSLSSCEVIYRDQARACYGRVNTVSSAPYAVITYVDVSDDVMDSMARRHFLTSRQGESAWVGLATNMAVVLAATGSCVVGAWSTGRLAPRAGLTIAAGLVIFASAYVALRIVLYTTTFVD